MRIILILKEKPQKTRSARERLSHLKQVATCIATKKFEGSEHNRIHIPHEEIAAEANVTQGEVQKLMVSDNTTGVTAVRESI
jgi:hypothetical protein